ncbi:export ABC transporter ATP-binding protein [Cohnella sp. CIP 111063]|uniref:ABC transporter ATP-binding protein n=1 Tax=unclassified Cohnella TaxID=2636738 RepID=UPI000B8C3D67|nr:MULTISPECIES: ABC transporter ATP-binding protein [unclassified Cohnella]OXS62378.1 export ABC transporter ATP-binding protein [Cohnella sp. CIP 111063]PRX74611.1 ABC-2 type transport system ATP-binding protein [Cohnella sp. SGD-V74]
MTFVQFKEVVKKYDTKISVNHLNLDIAQGEIFGLLGPNGAGKSTTIHLLSGLLPMDAGEVLLDGYSVAKRPLETKSRIGLVPQELAIYELLSARENVTFFAKLYGLRGNLLKERVEEALEFTGLRDFAKDRPAKFSGGMKRRLNIACAIVHRPKLIIMDEPTVGIDPQSRNHILESVRKLNEMGSTVIYTSHYMEEVEAISTRIGIMDKGRLVAQGTKEELNIQVGLEERLMLETNRLTDEAAAEIRSHPRVTSFQRREDAQLELVLQESQAYLQDILFILTKHELKLQKLTRVEPDLESLFLALTGRTLRDKA